MGPSNHSTSTFPTSFAPSRSALAFRLVLCAFSAALAHPVAHAQLPTAGTAIEVPARILPLEVQINGVASGLWPLLERAGTYFAPDEAFDTWRIKRDASPQVIEYRGLAYRSISGLPRADLKLDAGAGTLALLVDPTAFATTRIGTALTQMVASHDPATPAFFANYDLSGDYSQTSGLSTSSLGVTSEVGFSSNFGVVTSSFVGRNIVGSNTADRHFTRLNTTFRRDVPERQLTFSAGDATIRTGYLGRPNYFGGIQVGTNYSITPGFNKMPIPIISGETRAPSTVQLYINNVLRQTSRLPTGPFTLENLPTVTGSGEVSVVVRDLLGRETVISQPFYVATDLLAPGLDDWSAEAGWLRKNLGITSYDYSEPFLAGVWRRGITQSFTLEGRAERTADLTTLGAATTTALGGRFLGRLGMHASQDAVAGAGRRILAGLDAQNAAGTLGLYIERNTRSFLALGDLRDSAPIRLQASFNAGLTLGAWGGFGVGVVTQRTYDNGSITALSLNHFIRIARDWQLRTSLSRTTGTTSGQTIGVTVIVPLERRAALAVTSQSTGGNIQTSAVVSATPEGRYGTGWRLRAAQEQSVDRAEGGLYYFGSGGLVSGEVSAARAQSAFRLGASGGLIASGGAFAAIPRLDGAAALVEVPGYPDIGITVNGQPAGTTDSNGRAIVAGLSPYQRTSVQLSANDLPVTAEIDNIERSIVPKLRSVVRLNFDVRGGRGAMVRIVLDDGEPAPAGAAVVIEGENKESLVSRRGDAYVTGMKEKNTLELRWKGHSCTIQVDLPATAADQIDRVGPFTCRGLQR
jgi:outer membrane usher protein